MGSCRGHEGRKSSLAYLIATKRKMPLVLRVLAIPLAAAMVVLPPPTSLITTGARVLLGASSPPTFFGCVHPYLALARERFTVRLPALRAAPAPDAALLYAVRFDVADCSADAALLPRLATPYNYTLSSTLLASPLWPRPAFLTPAAAAAGARSSRPRTQGAPRASARAARRQRHRQGRR